MVDEHPLYRLGVGCALEAQGMLASVVSADTLEDAWTAFQSNGFDLVICDVAFQSDSGLDLFRRIRDIPSLCPILVTSFYDERYWAERALRAGANGYLMKYCQSAELRKAVDTVLRGDIYLSLAVQQQILRDLSGQTDKRVPLNLLTVRETEVFQHLAQGENSEGIAKSMFISLKTVQTHQANIRKKLDVASLAELRELAHSVSGTDFPGAAP